MMMHSGCDCPNELRLQDCNTYGMQLCGSSTQSALAGRMETKRLEKCKRKGNQECGAVEYAFGGFGRKRTPYGGRKRETRME